MPPAGGDGLVALDLGRAQSALRRFDKDLGAESVGVLRDEARRVQGIAQGRMAGRPGGGTYPVRKGAVGRFANQKGAGVSVRSSRYPWMHGAEFGARRGWTPRSSGGIRVHRSQARWRRRQFPVWRGNKFVVRGANGPGWIVQPTIRKELDTIRGNLEKGLSSAFSEAMDRAGVGR